MSTDPDVAAALRAHVEQTIGKVTSVNDDPTEYSWRRAQEDRGRELNAYAAASPGDLVSGVLTRLAEMEEAARDAMQRRWLLADNYVEDENGAEVATFSLSADAHLAAFAAEPDRVLRLCRAHRQIVEMAQRAAEAGESALMTAGEHARSATLDEVVELLAVGLGVVEAEDDK